MCIGQDVIVIMREIAGIETRVTVPTASYRGVTLRVDQSGRCEIILLHIDPSLDLILARADDDSDVIAEWRRLGRVIGLPLLVEDAEGRLQPVIDVPEPMPSLRRGGSALKHRRPRFLARRQTGPALAAFGHCAGTVLPACN